MQKYLFILALSVWALAGESAHAAENNAPVCVDKTVDVGDVPAGVTITTIEFDPVKIGACTDADGDSLNVISVSAPGKVASNTSVLMPYPDQPATSVTISYTVIDPFGATATANLTVRHQ